MNLAMGIKALARRLPSVRGAAIPAAAVVLLFAGSAAQAQMDGRWWEKLTGFERPGTYAQPAASERPERRMEDLHDLRPGNVPLRSDAEIQALERAVARYQDIASAGGWPLIPGTRAIRPEDDDERIPILRRRLQMTGELRRSENDDLGFGFGFGGGYSYDAALDRAVRQYQQNNGLRVTGRVDKPTLDSLNVPAHARLAQLKLNLQRIHDLMAQRIEDRYVLVNPPAFQLEAVEFNEVAQRHRVIAGKPDRQTPTVKATIRALNFFPYWRVPESVANLDLIPRLRKEPDYLQKEQIRVLTGSFNGPEVDAYNIDWRQVDATKIRFRQDPGPQNALGLVRIDMPNEHGVYMHDTPMKPLFNQRARAFSAGCVRVQDVFGLVEWIARYEPGWEQPGRVQAVISGGQPLDLTLTRPVPVYFTYITAWAETDGSIQFRPDIYGRDGVRDLRAGDERDPSEGPVPSQSLAP
ncbi:MAG: murein L,D-transpeptidase [Hyphomicrobiaceae bacterium]